MRETADNTRDDYEEAMKALGRFAGTFRVAAAAAQTLEDKLAMQKGQRDAEEARRLLRLNIYGYDDAMKLAIPQEAR